MNGLIVREPHSGKSAWVNTNDKILAAASVLRHWFPDRFNWSFEDEQPDQPYVSLRHYCNEGNSSSVGRYKGSYLVFGPKDGDELKFEKVALIEPNEWDQLAMGKRERLIQRLAQKNQSLTENSEG
jgi:hypothetical protein